MQQKSIKGYHVGGLFPEAYDTITKTYELIKVQFNMEAAVDASQDPLNFLWPPSGAIPGGMELDQLKRETGVATRAELYTEHILCDIKGYVDGSCEDNANINDTSNIAGWGAMINILGQK